jgi:hypothetical protein
MKDLTPVQRVERAACGANYGTISFFGHVGSERVLVSNDHVIQGSYVDAASAVLTEGVGVNRFVTTTTTGKSISLTIKGTAPAQPGHPVIIFGATSGAVPGTVKLVTFNNQPVFTDRLVIEVAPGRGTDVLSGSGDSGAPVIDAANKLVGIMFGRGVVDPNSLSEQSSYVFASHIAPVLSRLNVTFDPAPAPSAGEPVAPPVPQPDPIQPPWLTDIHAFAGGIPHGEQIFDAGSRHAHEVLHLVNHCRPVMVAWQRGKGPAWTAHLLKSWRDPDHVIPDRIDGITRLQLLTRMREELMRHGSAALVTDIRQDADRVFALAGVARVRDLMVSAGIDPTPATPERELARTP